MATSFKVFGPLEIPFEKGKAAKIIRRAHGAEFWDEHEGIAGLKGCYVFGLRAGGGIRPWYVGKATKSFKQETFTDHKLKKYAHALANSKRGTPVFFFVASEKRRGKTPTTVISAVERYLIHLGVAANFGLLNVQGTKTEDWVIGGVVRSKGKPSKAATAFCTLMNL